MKPCRLQVLETLKRELPGQNLFSLAEAHQIPVFLGSKKNKGWVGQTVERVAGLSLTSDSRRDGEDFELKTTCLIRRTELFFPKETIKITQLNPQKVIEEDFLLSALWEKLEKWILVTYWFPEPSIANVHQIVSVNLKNPEILKVVRAFWEDVRSAICNGEMRDLINLGCSQDYIQLRPLGDGKQMSRCPVSGDYFPARAFYATKKLVQSLLSEAAL